MGIAEKRADSSETVPRSMQRVIAYIDGFNLYFGLKSKGWQRLYWLNVQAAVHRLLRSDQKLVRTKYFTSRVSAKPHDPEKPKRQNTYFEALGTLSDFQMFFGHYLQRPVECWRCGAQRIDYDEKMTDVNIATELLTDAFDDRFDTALLVTADSDLTRPIEVVRSRFPGKRVVLAFPPGRSSERLRQVASAFLLIGRRVLAASQFPDSIAKPDGFMLRRPESWR
jgi:uncharacterized LabA/DUF88 family protein